MRKKRAFIQKVWYSIGAEESSARENIMKQETVNAIRFLAVDAIEKAKSGHPGLPLGAAPIAYALFQDFLKFDPKAPKWDDRDRFVLSAGHGSALLYALLHLYGYAVSTDDLKAFRTFRSKTPGHPEYGMTEGVETTTGPLGQGIANAVGMAMAEAHLAAKFNRTGYPVVDHYTYCLCGDGCLEEGISYEACSFAGAHRLGKLILLYDDNEITIEGNTSVTYRDDVAKRFEAQNWQVIKIDLVSKPDNILLITNAIRRAQREKSKPSIIIFKTHIGYGSPFENTPKCHGSPLGESGVSETRAKLGWKYPPFEIPEEIYRHTAKAARRGATLRRDRETMLSEYEKNYPDLAREYREAMQGALPDLGLEDLLTFEKPLATRQTSSIVLNKIAAKIPSLMGGSADLAPSNLTEMKDTESVHYGVFSPENYAGRNVHFGIREHAMAAIANGMCAHGGVRPYVATFFIFSDYCKHAMRLSALMELPVIYVLTHDSIGVGEDGPTHEPVEQLAGLRAVPGLNVFRPADGKETAAGWICALRSRAPTALVLSRQALPQYENSGLEALRGGYILEDCKGTPDVLLIASGSEVELCMKAKKMLEGEGIGARVVSMPCMELFEMQPEEYREGVIPSAVKARVCVEAASPMSWYKYAGDKGEIVAMTTFGASGAAPVLFEHFGFTPQNVAEKAKLSLKK